MPLKTFDFLCPKGHVTDYFDWDNLNPSSITCSCGEIADKVWLRSAGISPDRFWSGINVPGYGHITSRSDYKAKMERMGHAEIEPGWKEAIAATRRQQEQELKQERINTIVDSMFHGKPMEQDPDAIPFGQHEMDNEALEEITNGQH